ncbi:MAG: dicarboxylate/amino acid:cation symporter [Rikenellaceae bacterium]
MKIKGIAVHWLIFGGMVAGVAVGGVATLFGAEMLIRDWVSPWGDIFIRLLELIAIPLLFISLVKGIIGIKDTTKLAALGWRAFGLYVLTTALAVVVGIALVTALRPGDLVSDELSQAYFGEYLSQVDSTLQSAAQTEHVSPLAPLVNMIPNNAFGAMANNSSMLQVLVLAALLGVATITMKSGDSKPFRNLIQSLDSILSRCIDMAMYIAPVGIMALMANLMVDSGGDVVLLGALGYYSFTVLLGLSIFAFGVYPLMVKFFSKIKVGDYLRAMLPVQMMAISTSSSAATLPTTMRAANDELKISQNVTSFTLPLGVTINMDGVSVYQAITVIFIAQVMGIEMTAAHLFTIVATTVIASVGTPGIPGGVLMTLVMVLTSVGIPAEGLALVIALLRPLDMFITALNVTGDVAVSAVVAESLEPSKGE